MTSKHEWIKWIAMAVFFAVVLVAGNLVFFVVDTTEYAVVTQFGKPVKTILEPGLYWKWPEPVQIVQFYDNRLQVYEAGQVEFLTKDKKSLVVDYYGSWKVKDPLEFAKTVMDKYGAESRLSDVFSSGLGVQLGRYELSDLVNTETNKMKVHEMLSEVTRQCRARAAGYGIDIVNVELRTLNFPEKNRLAVFRRMKAEREQIARKYRSEGSEEAAKIRAEANTEQKQILSEAYKNAETTRGEGDAEAIRIYAEAFQKDQDFYKFTRTLAAYEKIVDEKTTVVLPANSELLGLLSGDVPAPAKAESAAPKEAAR